MSATTARLGTAATLLAALCLCSPAMAQVKVPPAPPMPDLSDRALAKVVRSAIDRTPSGAKEVVFIVLNGPFDHWGLEGKSISPWAMELLLEICRERKPAAIVLEIESPGGLVSAMDEIVDTLVKTQAEDKLRVVAWPSKAYSAAAVTCLACKEIAVRPTSIVGAATKVVGKDAAPSAETAMDHKIESTRQARRRQVAELTGRDTRILDAMEFPDRKLYFQKGVGFMDTPGQAKGVKVLDESTSAPMTMNAEELCDTGIAIGQAASREELVRLLKLDAGTTALVLDLASGKLHDAIRPTVETLGRWVDWRNGAVRTYEEAVSKKADSIRDAIRKIESLARGDGWSDTEQKDLERSIGNCAKLPIIDPALEEALQRFEGDWIECKELAFGVAQMRMDEAKVEAKARKTGSSGGKVVGLDEARGKLVEAHDALVAFLNGCK